MPLEPCLAGTESERAPVHHPGSSDSLQAGKALRHSRDCSPDEEFAIDSTATLTPAWIVYAWPPLLWQASRAPQLHLAHLGTRVLNFGDDESPCSGQTLWGDDKEALVAGVAWDWVRLHPGVVAMADPLCMVTNLTLLDDHGEALTTREAALRLHQLVHSLPWQSEVQRALHEAAA
jgi:hypothetical protein